MQQLMPLFYYHQKILIIDDDIEILQSIQKTLSHKFNIIITTSPLEAISIIKSNVVDNPIVFNDITEENELDLSKSNNMISILQFTIDTIHNIVNDKHKYEKYGVLIVDYDMPNINGIELSKKLEMLPIKKILLTGKYDITHAIKALNSNIVDCYVRKGEENTMEEIKFYIDFLYHDYFTNLSTQILNTIPTNKLNFLRDKIFITILSNIIKEHNIVEYYLVNRYGTYLLISEDKNRFAFVCYAETDLVDICEIYNNDPSVQGDIDKIKNRQCIPFFDIYTDPLEIRSLNNEKCLHKANKTNNFYWAIINLAT